MAASPLEKMTTEPETQGLKPIPTERFGELRVPENEILTFPEGLLGFADCKQFVLVQESAFAPFIWLQSTDDPHLCFVVIDPQEFMSDYRVEIKPVELAGIELADMEKARVLVIVVVREDPEQITANLQGPIILNSEKALGKQVVLLTDRYHTRHSILAEMEKRQAEPAKTGEA